MMTVGEQSSEDSLRYYFELADALCHLPENTKGRRRELYERIYDNVERDIANAQPPLNPAAVDYCKSAARYTVAFVETSVRKGIDLNARDFWPNELEETLAKLKARRDKIQGRELSISIREARKRGEFAHTDDLRLIPNDEDRIALDNLVACYKLVQPHYREADGDRRPNVLISLFIMEMQNIAAEDNLAIVWMFTQPVVLLLIISSIYWLIQASFVMNMDVPTFALLGSGAWIMCRTVIFRVSGRIAHHRFLLNIPHVSPLDLGIVQAVIYLLVFTNVFVVLITSGFFLGMLTLPSNAPLAFIYLIGLLCYAFSTGCIFGTAAVYYPFFLRFASVIERLTMLFSSVFFVSEQLPSQYKPFVLWNPLAHGFQLMRAAYFAGYSAPDAEPIYFWSCLALFMSLALLILHIARARIQPL